MIVGFALVLAGQLAPDSTRAAAGPRMDATVAGVRATADTLPRRRRAVAIEYSDAYSTRQTIHKISSMAMLPLFAAQYASGQQLMLHGADAAPWARSSHGVLAGAVGTLFAVNTVTGGLNLWEGRKDPNHRAWRTTHGVLMLVADAGFALTGAMADGAEGSSANRNLHKQVGIGSASIALVSYLMMLPPFRRD